MVVVERGEPRKLIVGGKLLIPSRPLSSVVRELSEGSLSSGIVARGLCCVV